MWYAISLKPFAKQPIKLLETLLNPLDKSPSGSFLTFLVKATSDLEITVSLKFGVNS